MFVYDEKDTEEESQRNFMAAQSFSGSSQMADPNHSDWTASIFFFSSFISFCCSFLVVLWRNKKSVWMEFSDQRIGRYCADTCFTAPLIVMDFWTCRTPHFIKCWNLQVGQFFFHKSSQWMSWNLPFKINFLFLLTGQPKGFYGGHLNKFKFSSFKMKESRLDPFGGSARSRQQ